MDVASFIDSEPGSLANWSGEVYARVRGVHLTEAEWRALYEFGVGVAVGRGDLDGVRSMIRLAANYFDSIGDQFGCLPYIEELMQRVGDDAASRTVVLECTRDIMVGNS